MRTMSSAVLGAMAAIALTTAAVAAPEAELVSVFDRHQIEEMRKKYEECLTEIRPIPAGSLEEWETVKADVRKRAMHGFGLDPLPDDVPLNIVYGDEREYEDMVLTRIMYQSFPGLYVTAFLGIPKGVDFPVPGIMYLQGHFDAENAAYSVLSPVTRRGYAGLMVLTVHDRALRIGLPTRGVQLWNNIRGLDVLCSLPEVDETRIGAYGSSGGGMQSMDLAAMDERVKAVAPVSYPAAFRGTFHAPGSVAPCSCNEGPLGAMRYMDNHWFLAMIAPRPLAVMCVTGDWTRDTIDSELPMISAIYDLYRDVAAGPSISQQREGAHVRIASDSRRFIGERFRSGHAQAREMYVRAFWWFDWWLKDQKAEKCDLTGSPYIGDYGTLSPEFRPDDGRGGTRSMNCAPPAGAQRWSSRSLIRAMPAKSRRERAHFDDLSGLQDWQRETRSRFAGSVGEAEDRDAEYPPSEILGAANTDEWRIERLWFASEPEIRIPALLIRTRHTAPDQPLHATVMLLDGGKDAVFDSPGRGVVDNELASGRQVLAIDQRWRGEWYDPGHLRAWRSKARVYARPEPGMAACDARYAAIYLLGRKDVHDEGLRIVGLGAGAGFAALIAAALDARFAEAVCDLAFNDRKHGRAPIDLPGLEFDGFVEDWAALVAPRRLTLLNVNPATGLDIARRAYDVAGAVEDLRTAGDRSVPLVNGRFEDGTVGWELLRGTDGIEVVERPLRGGNNALMLRPGQTVISTPFPVEPYRDYHVHVHGLTRDSSATVDLKRNGMEYPGVMLAGGDAYRQSIFHFLPQPGETSGQVMLSNTGGEPVYFDCVVVEKGTIIAPPGEVDRNEILTVTSPANLESGSMTLPRWKPGKAQSEEFLLAYGPSDEAAVVEQDGIKALRVPDGKPYVVLGMPSRVPLRKGRYYRFTLTLRSRARNGQLLFWNIHRPRRNITPTGEWQTETWDFFAERDISDLPAIQFAGADLEVRAVSLSQIPAPATPLPCY